MDPEEEARKLWEETERKRQEWLQRQQRPQAGDTPASAGPPPPLPSTRESVIERGAAEDRAAAEAAAKRQREAEIWARTEAERARRLRPMPDLGPAIAASADPGKPPPDEAAASAAQGRAAVAANVDRRTRELAAQRRTDAAAQPEQPEAGEIIDLIVPWRHKPGEGPGTFSKGGARIATGALFGQEDKFLQQIALNNLPGSTAGTDPNTGQPYVEYMGKRYYVNQKGFSNQDLVKFGGDLIATLPGAGRAATGGMRVGSAALTSAAGSVAQDAATAAAGSPSAGDVGDMAARAGITGLVSGVVQRGTDAAGRVWNARDVTPADLARTRQLMSTASLETRGYTDEQVRRIAQEIDAQFPMSTWREVPPERMHQIVTLAASRERAGSLLPTPENRRALEQADDALRRAGLDPSVYTEQQRIRIGGDSPVTKSDDNIRRSAAQERSGIVLPSPVDRVLRTIGLPLTRGQRTGAWEGLSAEQRVLVGPGGGDVLQQHALRQDQELRRHAAAMTGGTAENPVNESAIGESILQRVRDAYRRSLQAVDNAYGRVDQTSLQFNSPNDVQHHVNMALGARVPTEELTPASWQIMLRLRGTHEGGMLPTRPRLDPQGNVIGYDFLPMTLEETERLRRTLNTFQPPAGPTQRSDEATRASIMRGFDRWQDDAITQAQAGNPLVTATRPNVDLRQQFDRLRDARRSRSEHGDVFEVTDEHDEAGPRIQKWTQAERPPNGQTVMHDYLGDAEIPAGSGHTAQMNERLNAIVDRDVNLNLPYSGNVAGILDEQRRAPLHRMLYAGGSDVTRATARRTADRIRESLHGKGHDATAPLTLDEQKLLQLADELDSVSGRERGASRASSTSGSGEVMTHAVAGIIPPRLRPYTGPLERVANRAEARRIADPEPIPVQMRRAAAGPVTRAARGARDYSVWTGIRTALYDRLFRGQDGVNERERELEDWINRLGSGP